MSNIENKIKQREALENLYGNFVEPHINWLIEVKPQPLASNFVEPYIKQLIEVNSQPLPGNPVALPCFCSTSGWLLVTLLYCRWMRWRS
ncbi:MAG TPA: hypothetical protein V6D13_06860 [Halomicronema sp.]